jgi:hypothetical protein
MQSDGTFRSRNNQRDDFGDLSDLISNIEDIKSNDSNIDVVARHRTPLTHSYVNNSMPKRTPRVYSYEHVSHDHPPSNEPSPISESESEIAKCFIDTWDAEEGRIKQTITYHSSVEFILNTSNHILSVSDYNTDDADGLVDFEVTFSVGNDLDRQRTHLFRKTNIQLGKGGFGTIHVLLYLDQYTDKFIDVGLVVKYVADSYQAELEASKISSLSESCCVIQSRALSNQHFVMRRVDGDLHTFFERYTGMLSDHSRGPYFMQRFTIHLIDKIKSMFSCIHDKGYRYFDIKLSNIGYRFVVTEDETYKIELTILDIGSISKHMEHTKVGMVRTYEAPEWKSTNQHRKLVARKMFTKKHPGCNVDDNEVDANRMLIEKSYVWLLSRMLYSMFMFHPVHGSSVKPRKTIESIYIMGEIFPAQLFPLIYTGINVYPDERQLNLTDTWKTFSR